MRKVAAAILLSPIVAGALLFVGFLIVWKLPMLCCARWRIVRYLPLAGIVYYGLAGLLVLVVAGLNRWELLLLVGMAALGGDWLLPDPITYFLSPRKRQAVIRAIEYLEAKHQVLYGMVGVIGSEAGRTTVSVAIDTSTRPPGRRFIEVGHDRTMVEELDFEYVQTKHGVRPWL